MTHPKRRIGTLALVTLLLLAAAVMVFYSVLSYANGTWREIEGLMFNGIAQRADNQAEHLRMPLESRLRHLEALAAYLNRSTHTAEDLREILHASAQTQGFENLASVDATGAALCADGETRDFSDLSCLAYVRAGESGVYAAETPESDLILLAAPLADGGALVAALSAEALAKDFLVGTSDSFLVTADGRIVASNAADAKRHVGQTLSSLLGTDAMDADIAQNLRAVRRLANGSQDLYVACAPLNVGGWQVVSIVSVDEARSSYAFMYNAAHLLELRLALCAGVILAVAVWLMRSKTRQIRAEKLRLEWSEERYRVLAQDSNEVFWEYDLQENRLRMGENFNRLCGRAGDETLEGFLSGVHPNDCPPSERCSARAHRRRQRRNPRRCGRAPARGRARKHALSLVPDAHERAFGRPPPPAPGYRQTDRRFAGPPQRRTPGKARPHRRLDGAAQPRRVGGSHRRAVAGGRTRALRRGADGRGRF